MLLCFSYLNLICAARGSPICVQALARSAALHEGGAEMQRSLLAAERAATDQGVELAAQVSRAPANSSTTLGSSSESDVVQTDESWQQH